MGNGKEKKIDTDVRPPAGPGPSPPPYSERDGDEGPAPPDYDQALAGVTPNRNPYFPSVMNLHGSRLRLMSADLCGETARHRLYFIDFHTGLRGSGPLGTRPGILIRNGPSGKAPILAAAGYMSASAAHASTFDPESIVLVPGPDLDLDLDPQASTAELVTETMSATASRKDNSLVFRFAFEVGEKQTREGFAWCELSNGADGAPKQRRFRLLRLSGGSYMHAKDKGGGSSTADLEGEVVAMLTFYPTPAQRLHYLSLELLGSGRTGGLGRRWGIMAIATALRLWMMRDHLPTMGTGCVSASGT